MSIQVNTVQAKNHLASIIKARLVPMLAGSPGVGKSSIAQQLADEYNLKLIDVRLAQCDPTDLLGFPMVDKEREKASYVPMSTFPVVGDPIPKGYSGWLVLLDEFTSAAQAVQAAAYKIVLDFKVGEHPIHPNVAMICAGNLETDNAIVQPMSTALQSRLVHLELMVDHQAWIDWATSHDIDHRITSFIKFKPDNLYRFNPDHDDKTYAAPRTWEFTNRLIQNRDISDKDLIPLLAGTISEGVAREFLGFCKIYNDLPTMDQIKSSGATMTVPTEPSVLYALTGAISNHANENNIGTLMDFITRLPIEFQVVCMREVARRDQTLIKSPAVNQWITRNATDLF